ncbi:hypothetical protein [Pantoea sp. V108_6]|uniref:hypothetical protein n=1 Tax=Pantoea sp. V108_6 TaxID=3044235 RepID=UPI00249EDE0B|nr:hypothetical protein [Pantoea sp. V108_6]MDI3366295.1 hypothetical protein [Pantoea sp. V108_6]
MKNIHPIVKAARERKIPHPAQLEQFHQKHWLEYMTQIGPLDAESTSIISGATWLNNHFHILANTRKQICFKDNFPASFEEIVRAHIASANYGFWQVSDEQKKNHEVTGGLALEQMVLSKTSMVGKSDPVGANQVNMNRLDSLRGPLFELFNYKDRMHQLYPNDRPMKLSKMKLLLTEMRMSQHFHNFSWLWQELLYGRTTFSFEKGKVFFVQLSQDYHLLKAISEFRRDHFIHTSLVESYRALRFFPYRAKWNAYLFFQPGSKLKVVTWQTLSESQKSVARHQQLSAIAQLDDHLKILLLQKYKQGMEYKLQVILSVWAQMSVLSLQITELLYNGDEIEDWEELLRLSPTFERTDLIKSLCYCCDYNEQEISSALDLLTWRGKSPQEDLWAQPFVCIDQSYVFPVSAFLTSSLSRNIDCWMGKIDKKNKCRGFLFEQELIKMLQNTIKENDVMKKNLHYTAAIQPIYNGIKEEIDLTFSFGNLLVIVEARSRKTPITPLDYDNDIFDENGLFHKTNQALRKVKFVKNNLKVFCNDYYPHFSELEEIKVIPLVIINGQFHAGFPLNGVPIIDPSLLKHFINDREIRFMAQAPYDRHQYGVVLWENIEEAQARFIDYLMCPTLIKSYKSICQKSEQRSHNLGSDFDEVITLSYEMECGSPEYYIENLKRLFQKDLKKYF